MALALAACSSTSPRKTASDPHAGERAEIARRALAVLQAAGRHEDPEVRAAAALTWGGLGNRAAAGLLRQMLGDVDLTVQVAAAAGLGLLGDPGGLPALKAILRRKAPPAQGNPLFETRARILNGARAKAVRAMAELEGEAAAPALQLLRADPAPEVSEAATACLAKVGGSEEAFKSFIPMLRSESEGERIRAIAALASIPDPRALSLLKEAGFDKAPQVRLEAVKALGVKGDLLALPDLQAAAEEIDPELRVRAFEALGKIRHPAAGPVLERLYAKTIDARERLYLWRGLARLGRAKDLEPAVVALRFADAETRLVALDGLEAVGGIEALRRIAAVLEDADMKVRIRAVSASIRLAKPAPRNSR